MKLALIWAMARNRTIGRNNALPWLLPEDMKYFKRVTMGKPIIMGRKTWDSIGRPLPGRTNIVITRDRTFHADGVKVVHTLDDALSLAENISLIDGAEEVVVIGGAEIYALALPRADRLYMTQVHADVDGDAHFPAFNLDEWQELTREDHQASDPNPYDYSFIILERKTVSVE
ncbi:MAG: type 3 dihydrofolate reductase [Gammaproteobacteria bacterium]|nr:type 3 dihydrofolate reductase [Gammaproteobacteria bacterium]MDP2141552.1 type 3 dihydrofolate reductase [Gammaproteobacteria bacterium]MDP2346692.1 type 3 dihydrofolate reductase [Gammaproteobacteria bacterium]